MSKKKDKESYEIEVFKSGTHTDSAGNVNTWTDDDLDEIVALYNEQGDEDKHTAPLVIGHPKDNKPAVGWIQSLKKVGSKLLAVVTDLSEEIKESVNKGEYKKVSISLYPSKLLRHIGLLGAMPPAVKGLADVEFSEAREKQGYALFEYEDAPAAEPSPDDALKTAQAERAKKYGITAKLSEVVRKEEIVELRTFEKPEQYAAIDDEMFADPVNYRFPIDTKANFLSSLSLMREYRWRDTYNELERATLQARMIDAKERLGITDKDQFYLFSEEPESPRKKRADKHKIKIVENKGHDTIPDHYSELAEEEFADPVNLRFPIAKKYLLGSLASWSRDAVRTDYSDEEQVIIAARIIKAAEVNKINLTPYKWAYVDVDPAILNRKQLLTIIEKRNTQNPQTTNNNSPHKLEFSMNDQIFSQFIADLTAWATEALGEDVATQMSAKITELSEALKPAGDTPPSDNSEGHNAELIALRKEVEILQKKDRQNVHNSFTESLIREGKMLPAQRTAAVELLEATHASTADFSETQKNVNVAQKLRDFMGTYPQIVDFSDGTGNNGDRTNGKQNHEFADSDDETLSLHEKVVAKAKEIAAQRGIADYNRCYAEALRFITTI